MSLNPNAFRNTILSVSATRLTDFSKKMEDNLKRQNEKRRSKKSKRRKSEEKKKTKKSSEKSTYSQRKKFKTKMENRKTKREESPLTDYSDMEPDGLDLKNKLFPLTEYLKDRNKLMDNVFKIVKDDRFKQFLPDSIKDKPISEIQSKCLQQLEVMSAQRLEHVITGQELDFSSGTESSLQTSPTQNENGSPKIKNSVLQRNEIDSTTTDIAATSAPVIGSSQTLKVHSSNPSLSQGSAESDQETEHEEEEHEVSAADEHVRISEDEFEVISDYEDLVDELLEGTLENSRQEQKSSSRTVIPIANDIQDEIEEEEEIQEEEKELVKKPQQSRLEIMELEMRARAIRSLMKNVSSSIQKNTV